MSRSAKVFLNGRLVDAEEAAIRIDDRGFLLGDALYESIRIYRGGLFRFREHWDRLSKGAEALHIPAPPQEVLRSIVGEVARANHVEEGSLRITLTRGPGGEGLRTIGSGPPTLLVTARPLAPERLARAAVGFKAIVAQARRSSVGLPSAIKSANRLDAILARLEADAAGVDEAILLSSDGFVAEGTISNVFWRSGAIAGGLRTPELGLGILPGVTRMVVLEVCAELGISVEEGRWALGDLRGADEVFVTMSSLGPVSLAELDGRALLRPGDPIFPKIRETYWSVVAREAAGDLV